jgi:uncharacterized membrane protein
MGSIGIDWHYMLAAIANFVLFFILIGLFIWVVIKLSRNNKTRKPIDIAKDRYAQGKITLEEFDQIKRELSKE